MPKHAPIVAAGFLMHAILRGNDRSVIVFDDADYRKPWPVPGFCREQGTLGAGEALHRGRAPYRP